MPKWVSSPAMSIASSIFCPARATNALPAERLAQLRVNGALALTYAQLFSINQLEQLKRRARFLAERDASGGERPLDDIDVDDDGELPFDFDN